MNCECCGTGWPGPRPMPARYRWVSAKSGNVFYLCEECCAGWRANAEREPALAPRRVTSI